MRRAGICLVVAASLLLVPPALASELFGDRDVTDATLQVNGRGEALVSYTRSTGAPRRVLVWGAVNALAPSQSRPQVRFSYDYSGGWRKYGRQVWRTFPNRCQLYDGPLLPNFVAACKAPDGSYWALQRWQRYVPMRGVAPFRPGHGEARAPRLALERAAAGARGFPELDLRRPLAGDLRATHLPGGPGARLPHALGKPARAVCPLRLHRHAQLAPSGRAGSAQPGSSRMSQTGPSVTASCRRSRRLGIPLRTSRQPGNGERHRVTVMGPGVTPVVRWEGAALGSYDRARDSGFNALFDRLVGAQDRVCRLER